MEALRDKKLFFIETLSADASLVLQHAAQNQIITKREYNNLNHPNYTQENIIINLLDKVMNKGDQTCVKFLQVLQHEQLQENLPELKKHFTPALPALSQDGPVPADEVNEYKMSSIPRGICLIINNGSFVPPLKERKGSDADEESLKEVLSWLGFTLEVHRDQTAQQMKTLLEQLGQRQHDGDCFVCCILSHGDSEGVYGTDGGLVSNEDIRKPFRGTSCPSLANKPKVFFIQACRGKDYQMEVLVQADNTEAEETEEEAEIKMEVVKVISIPADGDFLMAMSTVKGFYSFRNILTGSWFIQSLCAQLKKYCPRNEDVLSILTSVNQEVSRNIHKLKVNYTFIDVKQMPVQEVTLRKKLFFRVPK